MFFLSSIINYIVEACVDTNLDENVLLFTNLVRTIESSSRSMSKKNKNLRVEEQWMEFSTTSDEEEDEEKQQTLIEVECATDIDVFEETYRQIRSKHKLCNKKMSEACSNTQEPVKELVSNQLEIVQSKVKTCMSYLFSAANEVGKALSEAGAIIKKNVEESNILRELSDEKPPLKVNLKTTTGVGFPPWFGRLNEHVIKEECLNLSFNKRNFLSSPPPGANFQFDYDNSYPDALAAMQHDLKLVKIRYKLVPKLISEENFWKNYFYRVNLICQANELLFIVEEDFSAKISPIYKKVKNRAGGDVSTHRSFSNSRTLTKIDEDMSEFEVGNSEEDWERELDAELRASSIFFTDESPYLASYSDTEVDAILGESYD